jgi:hypothetical protein
MWAALLLLNFIHIEMVLHLRYLDLDSLFLAWSKIYLNYSELKYKGLWRWCSITILILI